MSAEEREQFLAGLHVGVLSVEARGRPGPLAVPRLVYDYLAGHSPVSVLTAPRPREGAGDLPPAGR